MILLTNDKLYSRFTRNEEFIYNFLLNPLTKNQKYHTINPIFNNQKNSLGQLKYD